MDQPINRSYVCYPNFTTAKFVTISIFVIFFLKYEIFNTPHKYDSLFKKKVSSL